MVNVFHPRASLQLPGEDYVENAATAQIEASITASLPELSGLSAALTDSERVVVYESNAVASFVHFTLLYGDPFGCSEQAEPVIQRAQVAEPRAGLPNFGFALPSFS